MNNTERDYYEVLGIPRDADLKTIKNAYHRLAMKWHPDRNKSPEAEERFKEIAKAYAILSDPNKRSRYDARGFEGVAHFSHDDLFRNVDLGSIFGDLGVGFGPGGQSIFDRFFRHETPTPTRGRDLRIKLVVPLERINTGGKERVHFTRPVRCTACHGYGTQSGKPPPQCRTCGGTGHIVVTSETPQQPSRSIRFQQIKTCPNCQGRGTDPQSPCRTCGGSGQIEKDETLRVNIPPGIEEGMALRIPGHGLPGDGPWAENGDLYVEIAVAPDSRFQRRGADLWRAEIIDVADAVLGTRILVPTLDGEVEVKVPPATQPDEVLRLRGKGLPSYHEFGRGNLNIRIQVQIPKDLSVAERDLYERLRTLRH